VISYLIHTVPTEVLLISVESIVNVPEVLALSRGNIQSCDVTSSPQLKVSTKPFCGVHSIEVVMNRGTQVGSQLWGH
jgi:hypothetical protein